MVRCSSRAGYPGERPFPWVTEESAASRARLQRQMPGKHQAHKPGCQTLQSPPARQRPNRDESHSHRATPGRPTRRPVKGRRASRRQAVPHSARSPERITGRVLRDDRVAAYVAARRLRLDAIGRSACGTALERQRDAGHGSQRRQRVRPAPDRSSRCSLQAETEARPGKTGAMPRPSPRILTYSERSPDAPWRGRPSAARAPSG